MMELWMIMTLLASISSIDAFVAVAPVVRHCFQERNVSITQIYPDAIIDALSSVRFPEIVNTSVDVPRSLAPHSPLYPNP